jgi:Ni,Fe-hydrogenase III component G
METETALQKAEQLLKTFADEVKQPEPNRLDFIIPAEKLLQAVEILRINRWGYLSFITGLDRPVPAPADGDAPANSEGGLEVLYHFPEGAAIVTLRVNIPYSKAEIPSVCGLIPSASLYERELMEMFGVDVVGTPNTDRLLLPDEWPLGVYPLRKSYQVPGSANAEPSIEA